MSLIDREDLMNEIEKSLDSIPGDGFAAAGAKIAFMRAITAIKEAPTLTLDDLRPKGRWVHRKNGVAYCSECEADAVEDGTDFCPSCGADMRGGGGDA